MGFGGSSVRPKSGLKVPSLIFMRCGSKSRCRALGSAGAGVFWHLLLGVSALDMRKRWMMWVWPRGRPLVGDKKSPNLGGEPLGTKNELDFR